MKYIRPAAQGDLARIAEILVFNYRINFYPVFRNDGFYFCELQVPKIMDEYREMLDTVWVYDDGAVKGFVQTVGHEVRKLFVEPVLQGNGIGKELLEYAVCEHGADHLWALEKNRGAIRFYERQGFHLTSVRKPEEDTDEYLVRMER